jgi:probable HAF family extracellular repeat protein
MILRPAHINTSAVGISESGQIVGDYQDSTGKLHGFLYSNGSYTTLDPPGSTSTEAYGIHLHAGHVRTDELPCITQGVVIEMAPYGGADHGLDLGAGTRVIEPADSAWPCVSAADV